MKNTTSSAGYRIEKVYVADQEYKLILDDTLPVVTDLHDRTVNFGWDWRPIDTRRFEVVVDVTVDPVTIAPEKMSVRLIGVFSVADGELSLPLSDFLKVNGPAILFPFAREVISTMSARGPHGAFHLNPLNVPAILAEIDYTRSTGYEFLEANPEIAKDFALDYRPKVGEKRSA